MSKHLAKRFLSSLIALALFLTFMFFFTEIVIPNDFVQQFSLEMNREQREQLQHELGLDRPLWERFLRWAGRIVRGNLGTSLYGYPVAEHLKSLIPPTLLIFASGTAIAFLVGQWLGKMVAWRGPGWLSNSASFGAVTLYTTFPPWLAFLVAYTFARRLGWSRGLFDRPEFSTIFSAKVWTDSTLTPQMVMLRMVYTAVGASLILVIANILLQRFWRRRLPLPLGVLLFGGGLVGSWFALGFARQAQNVLSLCSLPILTYALLSFGETMLIMRTSMTDTLKEEYVITAQAKGLPARIVRDKHAARTALLPVLSRLVISLPLLLTGLVIIEDAFRWPGLSQSLFWSLYQQDMPMVMGAMLLVGVLSMIARLILDALYVYLDPRIRYGTDLVRRRG